MKKVLERGLGFLREGGKLIVGSLLIVASTVVYSVLAAPPGTPYNLGETLQPVCAPGDPNCTVVTPAASGANSDITSLSGLTTALSVGQGGTGLSTIAAGKLLYASGLDTLAELSLEPLLSTPGGVLTLDSSIVISGEGVDQLTNDANYNDLDVNPNTDLDGTNDLVDTDFGVAGLMATDGLGGYSVVSTSNYVLYDNTWNNNIFVMESGNAGLKTIGAGGRSFDFINSTGSPVLTVHDGGGGNPYNGALEVAYLPSINGSPVCYVTSPAGSGAGLMFTDCNYAYDLPFTDGAAGDVLTTDGFGNVAWQGGFLTANGLTDLTGDWVISTNDITLTAGTLTANTVDATDVEVSNVLRMTPMASPPCTAPAGTCNTVTDNGLMYMDTDGGNGAVLCIYRGGADAWYNVLNNNSPGNCV